MSTKWFLPPVVVAAVMLATPAQAQSEAVALVQGQTGIAYAGPTSIEPVTTRKTASERFMFEVACNNHYEPEAITRCLAEQ